MPSRWNLAGRLLAAASLIAGAMLGWQRYFSEAGALTHIRTWDHAARARFLERCRPVVPRGAAVLALTESVPAPDFDYWLGIPQPVKVLARVTAATLADLAREGTVLSQAELSQALAARGALLTDTAFEAALQSAEFVIIADLAGSSPALAGFEQILTEESRALWRRKPR